ncbi:MAG: hypothetical protein ACYDBB_21170 [Armatimonadota bacterium]
MKQYLLVVTAVILGMVQLTAQAYRLEFKDVAGTSRTYKTQITVEGSMGNEMLNLPVSGVVTYANIEKVNTAGNGSATLTYTVTNGTVNLKVSGMPGEDTAENIEQSLPGFVMTYTRTPRGKISNMKFNGDLGGLFSSPFDPLANQGQYPGQGLEFPDKDLTPGDTWTGKQTVEMGPGNVVQITSNYTFIGSKVIEGRTFMQINADITLVAPKMTLKVNALGQDATMAVAMNMTGKSETLFDPQAGQIYKSMMKGIAVTNMSSANADGLSAKSTLTLNSTTIRVK